MSPEYHRNYYHTKVDKKRKLEQQNLRLTVTRQFVWDYLKSNPCVDCPEADPIVLEFDHVRGIKLKAIADAVRGGWAIKRIEAEIAKCDVRCANCHRRKTHAQLGYYANIVR